MKTDCIIIAANFIVVYIFRSILKSFPRILIIMLIQKLGVRKNWSFAHLLLNKAILCVVEIF